MIKSLRESKAKLSELVERASRGEDVLITVRSRVKTRLTRATAPVGEIEMKAIFNQFLADLSAGRIVSIPYGADVVQGSRDVIGGAYRKSRSVIVRSLDAIHLASALLAGTKSIVATDRRLRECAQLIGPSVVP